MPGLINALLRGVIAFIILPNLVFFVVGQFFFLDRPLVNLDYAILGVLWHWLPNWARIAGFATAFIVDVVTATGSMYNINPVAGFVALFRAPIGLIITVVLAFAASCAIAAVLGALVNRFTRTNARKPMLSGALAAVVLALVLALSDRSAMAKLATDIVERDRGYRTTPDKMDAATDALREDLAQQRENVTIVIVESWGVLSSDAAHEQVLSVFKTPQLEARYHIRTGTIPFRGGTTSGELRELCGVFTDYLVLNEATISQCLPIQLKKRGFSSTALHGYKREYYSRHRWYPKLFDRILFEDSLAHTERRCGTQFRGICDSEVFDTFRKEVQHPDTQPRLTYWLTIDAHTPVDVERMEEMGNWGSEGDCGPPDFCLVVFFWRETLARIAQLAADPRTPLTRFIIVGDHAPAFVRQSRAARLLRGRVPFVELVPK